MIFEMSHKNSASNTIAYLESLRNEKQRAVLMRFFNPAYEMPRTALRYAIEKMDYEERRMWMER